MISITMVMMMMKIRVALYNVFADRTKTRTTNRMRARSSPYAVTAARPIVQISLDDLIWETKWKSQCKITKWKISFGANKLHQLLILEVIEIQ